MNAADKLSMPLDDIIAQSKKNKKTEKQKKAASVRTAGNKKKPQKKEGPVTKAKNSRKLETKGKKGDNNNNKRGKEIPRKQNIIRKKGKEVERKYERGTSMKEKVQKIQQQKKKQQTKPNKDTKPKKTTENRTVIRGGQEKTSKPKIVTLPSDAELKSLQIRASLDELMPIPDAFCKRNMSDDEPSNNIKTGKRELSLSEKFDNIYA
mmetsp:Transcript_21057/g.23824  ORF Transcript_21057/g.23824 Transcript_21057/m.23824 type:complete len:207 (-) Transcript_21057:339-959(-)|eukprot:CAMPEP_0115003050 /NCGR_PEP_ID=MMETSP0216-20121206/18368_1 /TAXON_ID=223996 /ORGANISM="Protocruzia adherens, Strain Boccale" /LENGTH=206 /DNA_ID=CAMNT_0002368757 /DNA_START=53 /DNA_END=673 /DNA_ORIENTATION=+